MNTKIIDGACYARMLEGGAAVLAAHVDELNALNVFPVADGDTGTNMLRTIEGGLNELARQERESVGALSERFARGVLLSARGNSGVILSQIFAGINEGLRNRECVDAAALAGAYGFGIAKSYAAVQNPTEGTILTVFRESTEYAREHLSADATVEEFFRLHIEEARRSLAATKDRLSVLAEADVVDSGAAGYLYLAEGMYEALCGKALSYEPVAPKSEGQIDIDRFTRDSVLEFGYCTEFLLRLTTAKVDPDAFELEQALSVLRELGGESVVAYRQDDVLKVHVHTFTPGDVLTRMQAFGEFLTIKIENMSLGHSETPNEKKKKTKKYAVVAVATGEGIASLFTQMGADAIVSGGQTANPSAEELIEAFGRCDAEQILVLPNNKNIILAAKQAAELYGGATVRVIETKSLMEGYAALSVITPGITDVDALVRSAEGAVKGVTCGEITAAVRDATLDGVTVRRGEYMALSGGSLAAVATTPEEALLSMLSEWDTDFCEIITIFVGKQVTDEARASLVDRLKETYGDCEIVTYLGGQDIYDYYVSME